MYSFLNTPDSRRQIQTHRQISPVKLNNEKTNLEIGKGLRFVGWPRVVGWWGVGESGKDALFCFHVGNVGNKFNYQSAK